jgi:CRISPR system Cascade subunit CasE
MNDLYLSRVMLRRAPSIDALVRQLLPDDRGDRAHAAHRLIWSLFAGDADRKRDFLFREVQPGKGISGGRTSFLVLSHGVPDADHPLLDVESKPFAPALSMGDRLGFSLRANPVQQSGAKKKDGIKIEGSKTLRRDVVMHALHSVARGRDRIEQRPLLIQQAGYQWLSEHAAKAGFRLLAPPPAAGEDDEPDDDGSLLRIDGYEQLRFAKLGKNGRISVLDYDGVLEVTEPDLLLARIASGFGRARAFGCGLMLIRRI